MKSTILARKLVLKYAQLSDVNFAFPRGDWRKEVISKLDSIDTYISKDNAMQIILRMDSNPLAEESDLDASGNSPKLVIWYLQSINASVNKIRNFINELSEEDAGKPFAKLTVFQIAKNELVDKIEKFYSVDFKDSVREVLRTMTTGIRNRTFAEQVINRLPHALRRIHSLAIDIVALTTKGANKDLLDNPEVRAEALAQVKEKLIEKILREQAKAGRSPNRPLAELKIKDIPDDELFKYFAKEKLPSDWVIPARMGRGYQKQNKYMQYIPWEKLIGRDISIEEMSYLASNPAFDNLLQSLERSYERGHNPKVSIQDVELLQQALSNFNKSQDKALGVSNLNTAPPVDEEDEEQSALILELENKLVKLKGGIASVKMMHKAMVQKLNDAESSGSIEKAKELLNRLVNELKSKNLISFYDINLAEVDKLIRVSSDREEVLYTIKNIMKSTPKLLSRLRMSALNLISELKKLGVSVEDPEPEEVE